jgi:hypothetical protein
MPLEITDGGLVQQDEITLWVNLLCVAVDEPHNNLCLRDNQQRSPSSYASMLRKTRVVRKVERGIDSDVPEHEAIATEPLLEEEATGSEGNNKELLQEGAVLDLE